MSRRLRPVVLLAALASVVLVSSAAVGVGNDPGLPQQWGLRQINAPTAWAGGAVVGAGVPIAIVDTGVDLGHEDLRDQIAGRVTCVNTGGDPARCVVDGADIEGHGSHVAGIAAASANGTGVSGVAPGARLLAVRVFTRSGDDYSASAEDINAGIRWAIRNGGGGKGVINLSLGGDFVVTSLFGASFADGIEEAWAAGWLPVLASGNENVLGLGSSNYGTLNALVVGATGPDDRVSSYSSPTGDAKWALVAPGGDSADCETDREACVLSTYRGGNYAYLQGTSMAAPHVAGAAALLMGAGRSNAQTVDRLLATADARVACGNRCKGRLDLAKAAEGLAPVGGGGGGPAATTAPPTTADGGSSLPVAVPATTPRSNRGTSPAPPSSTPVTAAPEEAPPVTEAAPAEAGPVPPTPEPTEAAPSEQDAVLTAIGGGVPEGADDRVPVAPVVLAALAALGVGGWAGVRVRRFGLS